MNIRALTNTEDYPWELLLLADPDPQLVGSYLMNSDVFVYQDSDALLGVIVLRVGGQEVEIMNLAVAEARQGQGIGRQLLIYGLDHLEEEGNPKSVIIKTGDLSGPALGLYKSLGFVIKETVENYFVDHYLEPIYEDGQQLKHQVILEKRFKQGILDSERL